jgi:hypothetical protein
VKAVLLLGQDAVELSGGDVDAQLVQLFQEQWLGDVLVVILRDDETDQGRSEVALGSDTFGRGPPGSGRRDSASVRGGNG